MLMPKLVVRQDENPMDPRTENENLGTMLLYHSRYTLGDKGAEDKLKELVFAIDNISDEDQEAIDKISFSYGSNDMVTAINILRKYDAAVVLPVHAYIHGGITISTTPFSDRFDSGQLGWIFAGGKEVDAFKESWSPAWREEYYAGKSDKEILETFLVSEVKEYDDYLCGNVYGYEVDIDGAVVESCWNYIGDEKYAEEDGKASLLMVIRSEIVEEVYTQAKDEYLHNKSLETARGLLYGNVSEEAINAIRSIAKAADEAGIPQAELYSGIVENKEEYMSLFKK